ncbi:MAG: aminotransferase class V-fold PLP-dependent enzyme [Gemmatimonadota bacterium]
MTAIQPLLAPSAFRGLEGVTHLCTGGEAPWLLAHDQAYAEFARLKSQGDAGRRAIYARGEEARRKTGALWGVPAGRVGFMPSAAEGMGWLARGLEWRAGDNVVTTNLEFPSVAYAWRSLRERGVEVRMVRHRDWLVREEDLLAAVDGRTRVLAASHVSFYTGQALDLPRLADRLRRRPGGGPLLAVDATHSAGVIDVPAGVCDLCVSSCYKWLLATHGAAGCYLGERAEAQARDSAFGWHNLAVWPAQGAERAADAEVKPMPEKLEPGNPAMVVLLFLSRALDVLLGLGIRRLEAHARDLSELIGEGLERLGHAVISPRERHRRSGNTCFLAADARAVHRRLEERGILLWGEYGRVRVSGHLHNGSADVERLLEALGPAY